MNDNDPFKGGVFSIDLTLLCAIPCVNCGQEVTVHIDNKCPFEASNYAPGEDVITKDDNWTYSNGVGEKTSPLVIQVKK